MTSGRDVRVTSLAVIRSRDKRRLWSLKYAGSSVRSRRRVVNGVALKCRRPSDKLISSSCHTARNRARRDVDESRQSSAPGPARPGTARSTRGHELAVDRWTGRLPGRPTPETDDRW